MVAKALLPNGKPRGHEWICGDVNGSEGDSCAVHLHGEKAGVWADFATGQSGDLLDLWQATKGISLKEAMHEAQLFLGISDVEFEGYRKKQWIQPRKPECHTPKSQGLAYLKSRGISEKTIQVYHMGEQGQDLIFPFLRNGQLVMAKRREAVDGAKPKPTEAGCEKCLFGWQAIPDNARDALICEGEIDAMSAFELGIPAMSVPYGAGGGDKQDWIENEFDHLERFDQVFVCMDRDQPGQLGMAEIVKRLGAHRCRIVDIPEPFKDVNDLLKAGWSPDQFARLLIQARMLDPEELRCASTYEDQVVDEFYPPETTARGIYLPWDRVQGKLSFRQGEVVLLAGTNGHGKTEMAGNLTLAALAQANRTCVASMEFQPKKWLKRITRQACGLDDPSTPYIREVVRWYRDKLWVFDVTGTAKTDRMLDVFDYAVRRYQIRLFVIDNLAKCGFGEDDYNGQKGFVDRLTDFAKCHDVTVILVAHMRKASDEARAGGKMDVKGSGAITDMVDTVLVIWRNKPKEERLRTDPDDIEWQGKPDALLRCEKQRNGEDEPKLALWFDRRSHQYLGAQGARPMRVVNYTVTAFGNSDV